MMRNIVLAALGGIALGLLLYLLTLSRTFDTGSHNQTLEQLRALKELDSRVNEETLRARLLIDPDSTALVDMIEPVRKAVAQLEVGAGALGKMGDPAITDALGKYRAAMEQKLTQVEEFEGNNLALIESISTIKQASEDLLAAVPNEPKYREQRQKVLQLTKEVLEYGLLPSPTNAEKVANLGTEVQQMAPFLPVEAQFHTVQISSRANGVLTERQANDQSLGEILAAPTAATLTELQGAYDAFHQKRLQAADFYRQALIVFAVLLMAGLAYLGIRLRGSYVALNKANLQLFRANETLEVKVQERTKDLSKAYAALKSSQAQVVQSEKMASLGQMVAGVAHEINTPLGFVRSNVELLGGMFKDVSRLLEQYANAMGLIRSPTASENEVADAINNLATTEADVDPHILIDEAGTLITEGMRGLNTINDLVSNLKDFSRLDRSRMDTFSVNDGLESTLTICRNQIKDRIEIIKDYGDVPEIQGAPSQINQVFLNMITNASQAIDGHGKIRLVTRQTPDGKVQVKIEDTGCGMAPEVQAKMFEPFFTTKDVGKGTGLGLSISYQIVKEHNGTIDVKSALGKGTTMTITLPAQQAQQAQSQPAEPVPAMAAGY